MLWYHVFLLERNSGDRRNPLNFAIMVGQVGNAYCFEEGRRSRLISIVT